MSFGGVLKETPALLWRTVGGARKDRIHRVAAEIAFFALVSIPSFLLILAGSAGFAERLFGPDINESLQEQIMKGLGSFLQPDQTADIVEPAVREIFSGGRSGIISLGALLAVWSASRIMRVTIEAMNIAYDIDEWRPAWRRALLAIGLTLGAVLALAAFLPFLVLGPGLGATLDDLIGGISLGSLWRIIYWPVVVSVGVAMLATLYHYAPNWKTPWRRDLPGAALAVGVWVAAGFGLRVYVRAAITEGAFGPLGAPVVLLLWLYATGLALLVGAELNAEIERTWPPGEAGPKADAPEPLGESA